MTWIHTHTRARARALIAAAVAALAALACLAHANPAAASTKQVAIIQDGLALKTDPAAAMAQFRELGATTIRVLLFWKDVAPSPNASKQPKFKATDPNAYDAVGWSQYDSIVREAKAEGLTVDLDLTGPPPNWAQGKGVAKSTIAQNYGWRPNATAFGQFVAAAAKRYDGSFTPQGASSALPKVSIWSLWNEPNFGQDLGPQSVGATSHFTGYNVSAGYYRNLLRAGYKSLKGDSRLKGATILIGELAGQGRSFVKTKKFKQGLPGDFAITWPVWFLQSLYCVDTSLRQLTGTAAKQAGCPTSSGAVRSFRKDNPALFSASAFSTHPYASTFTPDQTKGIDSKAIVLPVINRLETELQKLTGHYGAKRSFPLWSTEYGFITSPPQKKGQGYFSPQTAATYLNQAEYLSYKNRNVASFAQYLLKDPPVLVKHGLFASGLLTDTGKQKAGFNAWRLPVWLPNQSVKRNSSTEVWGAARPAYFGYQADHAAQKVAIQLKTGSGGWKTISTVTASKTNGYFDTHVRIAASGQLRLRYTYPTSEPFLPVGIPGSSVVSRTVKVTVH
jgi:hypothetical protein